MPGKYLSHELRARIVRWHNESGFSVHDIAALASCSQSTVYNILKCQADYGVPFNPFAELRTRPRILAADDIQYIVFLLRSNPTLYLDELQLQLWQNRQVFASLATLSRTLHRIAFSHKSLANEALERNNQLRATWIGAHGHYPKAYYVWLDESSVDDQTNHRFSGWSPVGIACTRRSLFLRGQRYSVLPALSAEGFIALELFEGSVTKERFIRFVGEQLVSSSSNDIYVLD